MKSVSVSLFAISGILFSCPESIEELAKLAVPSKEDASDEQKALDLTAGQARVLHAANQYFLTPNLINVRSKFIELVGEKYGVTPKLFIGKNEVKPVLFAKGEKDGDKTVDKEGVIKAYVAVEADAKGKFKEYKKDADIKEETDTAFFARLKEEKTLTDDDLKPLLQEAADKTPYDAVQKRQKGGVASKPVGKKWLEMAGKIIKAGNHIESATRLAKEIGAPVDVTGEDREKRLAIALAEANRLRAAKAEAELAGLAGTPAPESTEESAPTVVDGTK